MPHSKDAWKRVDEALLHNIAEQYERRIQDPELLRSEFPPVYGNHEHFGERRLQEELIALKAALSQVQEELRRLKSERQNQEMLADNNCHHWTELLQTNLQYMQHLELIEAQMGIDFPIYRRVELKERRKRVAELGQQIAANCSSDNTG